MDNTFKSLIIRLEINCETGINQISNEVSEIKVAYKELFRTFFLGTLALILAAAFVYSVLWAEVTWTDAHLYKRVVEQTIADMVKPEYLK